MLWWLRYHWFELFVVAGSAVGAVVVTSWLWLLAVLIGAQWLRHETFSPSPLQPEPESAQQMSNLAA